MKARGAAVALAILFGGVGFLAQGAEARTTDSRQAKPPRAAAPPPAARPAAAPVRTAAAPAQPNARQADATRRGSVQRGRERAPQTVAVSRSGRATAQRGGGGGGISCVPYARQATGMAISGNGGTGA